MLVCLLLFASLVLALLRDGPSFGGLLWVTTISLAALAFTLSRWPAQLRPLTMLAMLGSEREIIRSKPHCLKMRSVPNKLDC